MQGNLHARFLEGESPRGPTYLNPALIGGFGNFLMPLMVGGPDMANNRQVLLFSSTVDVAPKPNYTSYVASCASNDYNEPYKIFGSYLAGLFEGDGHI